LQKFFGRRVFPWRILWLGSLSRLKSLSAPLSRLEPSFSLVSIPGVILLAVAIFTVHLPYGFSSIKLISVENGRAQFGPPGYECDLLYVSCIVALVLIGPSPWSIDSYRSLHSYPAR
jgi:putative oxidoreductase